MRMRILPLFTSFFLTTILFASTKLLALPHNDPDPHPPPEPNGCKFLVVQLGNNTTANCTVRTELIHGSYYNHSTPPNIITSGRSKQFTIQQSWYGPDVKMVVRCGNGRTSTVHAQQNYCFMESGDITHEVLQRTNLGVEQNKMEGSFWHSIHGISNWLFS